MFRSFFTLISSVLILVATAAAASDASAQDSSVARLPDGKRLYAQYCASCHQPLEKTTKPQRSASRTRSAIKHYVTMNDLDFLTDAQLEAIAAAMKTVDL